jgi:Flp pilus assembly protein TadD
MRRSARTPEDRRFATDVMVCSAYTLLDDGNKNQAVGLFDRIAGFDPGNLPALLGAAAIHERYGRYEQATMHLQRLVEHHPDSGEGRLRLAVNLARLHRSDDAERVLHELVADTDQSWVRAVGYQELARRMMTSGRPEAAEQVLREAVAAVPDNHSLRIQLAVVLDLAHQEREAARVIEEIQPELAGAGASPRWRYAVWPAYDRPSREEDLRAQAAIAAPALAEALQAMAEESAS